MIKKFNSKEDLDKFFDDILYPEKCPYCEGRGKVSRSHIKLKELEVKLEALKELI